VQVTVHDLKKLGRTRRKHLSPDRVIRRDKPSIRMATIFRVMVTGFDLFIIVYGYAMTNNE
jgi:hypothetical protein